MLSTCGEVFKELVSIDTGDILDSSVLDVILELR
jgi:hypothetical protein